MSSEGVFNDIVSYVALWPGEKYFGLQIWLARLSAKNTKKFHLVPAFENNSMSHRATSSHPFTDDFPLIAHPNVLISLLNYV